MSHSTQTLVYVWMAALLMDKALPNAKDGKFVRGVAALTSVTFFVMFVQSLVAQW